MLKTPQIEAVTNFLKDHKAVLKKLQTGPIFLAQRSKPTAVLVSVAEWDHIVEEWSTIGSLPWPTNGPTSWIGIPSWPCPGKSPNRNWNGVD